MSDFEFTSPEGRKYTVSGPAGATKEQAFQILQARLGGGAPAQSAPASAADQIPLPPGAKERMAAEPPHPADPTLVERIIGGGETGLALVTGATTGAFGLAGGALAGAAQSVANGTFGTQEGVKTVEQGAAQGMNKYTYAPRTEEGQRQTEAWGGLLSAATPVMPLTAELGALGRGMSAARGAAGDMVAASNAPMNAADAAVAAGRGKGVAELVRTPAGAPEAPAVAQIRKVSPAIADRVQRTLARTPAPDPVEASTPGTMASGGPAGTDMATQRQQVASQVGVDLTAGQATRDQQQLRFEQETAKGEQGAKLRDRYSDQNEQVGKHFDNLVDMTGKETADVIGTGRSVDEALRKKVAQDKVQIRVAYKNAEKAGEMADPISLEDVVQHINENDAFSGTAPILADARRAALKTGIAAEDANGQLVAQPTTLKMAEEYRKNIGAATDLSPPNQRQSAIMKGLIDSATEDAGGDLYRAARRMRENFAKQYEDRSVIASLLNNKKGTADRKVAIADVFDHSILNASREDVSHVRRTLIAHPANALPEVRAAGQQAWRDLQGETMNWVKDQAFANTATDQRGNVILSVPKLDRAIKRLDADGRLDIVFGKHGAQHMRDLNDLAKVIYTTPPGSVNSSNTASVLLAAMAEAGVTGSLTGLPVPVLSTMRILAKHAKNRQLQKRIEQALSNRPPEAGPRPPQVPPRTLH